VELLEAPGDRGYPAEYLVSRIKGKRAGLISDWTPLVFNGNPFDLLDSVRYRGFVSERSAEGIWRGLAKEYRWVYLRMNRELLKIFSPFFLYSELRTIFICLRHISGEKGEMTGDVLSSSILSADIKKILRESRDVSTAAGDIEKSFLILSDGFAGLADICGREGLKGFERSLAVRYLAATVSGKLHPLLKIFFVRIIDSRNIISLYKYIRLEPKAAPPFIPHGSISEQQFLRFIERKDIVEIRRLAGMREAGPGQMDVEYALYRNITVFLKKAGRDPLGIGPILDYLWRCSIEAMNLSILYYGRDLERETVRMELVH
jgi:hypothetical protein